MNSIMGIVHSLRIAKGGNKKLAILKRESGNENWKKFLWYTYNTALNYWVSAPSDLTFYADDDEFCYDDFFKGINAMLNREFKGKLAREYALELSRKFGEPIRLVLSGSVKAGVSIKTINKAYPDLIPTFNVMLAENTPIEKFPVYGFMKYDGVRCTVKVTRDCTTCFLRSGKELGLVTLSRYMSSDFQRDGWYDGELVMGDGLQESRVKVTGNVNKVLKGSCNHFDGYTFQVFDWVPLDDWDNKCNSFTYDDRHRFLIKNLNKNDAIRLAHYTILHSQEDVEAFMEDLYSRGYEGGIFRYPEDGYEWKRTNRLIKGKAKLDGVVTCIGYTPGTGKYESMIGSLKCTGILDCEGRRDPVEVHFNVGSGLSDYDRDQDPSIYIGQEIEIQYNDIVCAENSTQSSVFIPVFKRIKDDLNI